MVDTVHPKKAQSKNNMLMVGIAAILVILIAVVVYHFASGSSPANLNTSTNSTSSLGVLPQNPLPQDLEKMASNNNLYVKYFSGNSSQYLPGPNNQTVFYNSNQTITSYLLANQVRTTLVDSVAGINTSSGALEYRNVSTLYYYNTSTGTIYCIGTNTLVAGVSNATGKCYNTNPGIVFLSTFPFTLNNLTFIKDALASAGGSSYEGTGSLDGRACDGFVILNRTEYTTGNYSALELCLDQQYGVPLYLNSSNFVSGKPYSSQLMIEMNISANVTPQQIAIPPAYLQNSSSV